MCALYAMARRIDDVGDGVALQPGQGPAMATPNPMPGWRPWTSPPFVLATAKAPGGVADRRTAPRRPCPGRSRRHRAQVPLPIDALEELVEGCSWDLAGRRYQSFDELVEYCRRVAGTIGRLSLAIYGSNDPDQAAPLADALGVALQLTNILGTSSKTATLWVVPPAGR